jgi:hypothetical protein
MKFLYKTPQFSVLVAIAILCVVLLYAFGSKIYPNYIKEGALTQAQLYSQVNKDEQNKIDSQVEQDEKNKAEAVQKLGKSPGLGSLNKNRTPSPPAFSIAYDPNDLKGDAASYASLNPEVRGSEKEAKQKKADIDMKLLNPNPVYYEPGSFPFSSTGYIPSYEDSVYLSRMTKMSQLTPIKNAPYLQGGFCTELANDTLARNEKCGTLDQSTCASTSCCVLLGGTKCMAGDANGPTIKSAFSDVTIPNKTYWYHQGKCSGNCP